MKKYFIYFIESLMLTFFTALVWFTISGKAYNDIIDFRYVITFVFINLFYTGIHTEFMKFDYVKESIKDSLSEYLEVVVPIGVMYFIQLVIVKIIMPIGDFDVDMPLLYIFAVYILYIAGEFKYLDKDKKIKSKRRKVYIDIFYIIISLLVFYVLVYWLLVPIQICVICSLTIMTAIKIYKMIKIWRKQEQTEV